MNCVRWLPERAAATPDTPAVIDDAAGRTLTYRDLDRRSDAIAHGLRSVGVADGARTLVLVRAGVDLITLTYAMFKSGAVPVLIDPGMGRKSFLQCVRQIAPTHFVGIPLGHVARILFPSAFTSVRTHVTVGARWFWGGPTLDALARAHADAGPCLADVRSEDEAAVLFTSGSTGPAKGTLYTHGIFDAQIAALRDTYGFREGEVDCAAFPLFSLFDNALGMTSVIPDLDPSKPGKCDPAKVARALERYGCTTAFGSPAIWRRMAPWAEQRDARWPKLQRVISAGASVPPALVEQLRGRIGGDVYTPYGATESLPVCTIDGATIVGDTAGRTRAGAGTCVGRPVACADVRIVPIVDGPVPPERAAEVLRGLTDGEVGEIAVRGPMVTRGYAGLPEATAKAKILDGDAIWHRMGDAGYRDADGRIWFCGRVGERIEAAGATYFPDRVEGVTNAIAGCRTAAIGVGPRGSQRLALVVESAPDAALANRLREAVPALEAVLFRGELPVDVRHNAKIHRLTLAEWAAPRMPGKVLPLTRPGGSA